jgi:hypothetical protein
VTETHEIIIACPKCGSEVGLPSASFVGSLPIHHVPSRPGLLDQVGVHAEFPGNKMRSIVVEIIKQCRLSGAWIKING